MTFANDSSQYADRLEQLTRRLSGPANGSRAVSYESTPLRRQPLTVPLQEPPRPPAAGPAATGPSVPSFMAAPNHLEGTGLSLTFIEDHVLRTLYFANELAAAELANELGVGFPLLDGVLKSLAKDLFLEVKGQRGIGDAGYVYTLTGRGKARALECLQKTWYRGSLPVPLERYIAAIKAQTVRNVLVTEDNIRGAFADLIIKDQILDQLGPAVNSGSSLFLFGAPGNGKTAIAERLSLLMGDSIYIPKTVEVDGYVIKLYDSLCHELIEEPTDRMRDPRWIRIKRPVVQVGGELTMAGLDLLWNEVGRFYEAPLQMKANGGIFFIDDFGRQVVRPADLLNRWIVPLEKRIDFLTLLTGKKVEVPFDELLVFSTNLNPEDLADEAFLRRIKYKVNVRDPDLNQFIQIMQRVCLGRGVPYDESGLRYMLERWWKPVNRNLRMCQPRDIIDQLVAIAQYAQREPRMEAELLDRACRSYFISVSS